MTVTMGKKNRNCSELKSMAVGLGFLVADGLFEHFEDAGIGISVKFSSEQFAGGLHFFEIADFEDTGMAVRFACPVNVDEAVADAVFIWGVVEYAGEDELVGSPAEFEIADDFRMMFQEIVNIPDGGGGEGEPVGTADDLIVQGEFPGGEELFLEHFVGKDLDAMFARDTPVDQVVFLDAGGGVFPFVFDGFAGDELEAFSLGDILIDVIRGTKGEILAGGDVYIVIVLREHLGEAVEGGLDGAVACPVDRDAVIDEEYIFFLGKKGEGGLVDLFVDMDVEIESRMVQHSDQPFQLLRVLMRQDQMCDSHLLFAGWLGCE